MSEAVKTEPEIETAATGFRIIYVRDGQPLASTFVPVTEKGLQHDLRVAAPEFAALMGLRNAG